MAINQEDDSLKNYRWSSFTEIKDDLSRGHIKLPPAHSEKHVSNVLKLEESLVLIDEVLLKAGEAETPEQFYDCVAILFSVLESADDQRLRSFSFERNLYIRIVWAVFGNEVFRQRFIEIIKENNLYKGKRRAVSALDRKKEDYVAAGAILAFYPVGYYSHLLDEENIQFLRKCITNTFRDFIRENKEISFSNLCFGLCNIISAGKFSVRFARLKGQEFIYRVEVSCAYAGISFISLATNQILGEKFKEAYHRIDDISSDFNLPKQFSSIYQTIYKIEKNKEGYSRAIKEEDSKKLEDFFSNFIRNNEKNILAFIKIITSGFQVPGKGFTATLLSKANQADKLLLETSLYAKKNLLAFQDKLGEEHYQWSNKVYIISVKTLAALKELSFSKDTKWSISAIVRELLSWTEEVHQVLNRSQIEDDWDNISDFLGEEGIKVEWKSSFFTPLEEIPKDEFEDKGLSQKLFESICKTILGMINTEGGVIIVGLVERQGEVMREDLKEEFLFKNEKMFFDVGHELEKRGKDFDQVRLQILEHLKNLTGQTQEKFNDLFQIIPTLIRGKKAVTIAKIIVKKSEKLIYSKKEEKGSIWISLKKRASGQTIDVDPRDYLSLNSQKTSL